MSDYTIEKIDLQIPKQEASYRIVEPKTIKDIDGNDVVVKGNTYSITMTEIDARILSTQSQLDKFKKIKEDMLNID